MMIDFCVFTFRPENTGKSMNDSKIKSKRDSNSNDFEKNLGQFHSHIPETLDKSPENEETCERAIRIVRRGSLSTDFVCGSL